MTHDEQAASWVLIAGFAVCSVLCIVGYFAGWFTKVDTWSTYGPNYRGEVPWIKNPPPNYHPN